MPKRVLVIDLQEPRGRGRRAGQDPRVFINPEIVTASDQEVPYNEGCLSVPDQYAEVERPDRIRARWLDENGERTRRRSKGCWRSACSTRWTISKAFCSSTICRGSSAR